MAVSERAQNIAVSIGVHALIVGVVVMFARGKILAPPEEEYIEFEMVTEVVPPEPEPVLPTPLPVEIPTVKRPEVVPEKVVVKVRPKVRAFQQKATTEESTVVPPDNTEAVVQATSPQVFAMTQAVGGGSGFDYTSSTTGTIAIAPPGPGGGKLGATYSVGATEQVQVAADWQISVEAVPTNARSFEPTYPPLAKRQGLEAAVVVRLDIDKTGKVVAAKAIEGPTKHGFQESALVYAQKLRFKPALAGTNPVASRIEWTVHFYVRN